ncbi:TBP associated factor 1C [Echinococcus multilocularis]|uniref:TBP associated factor 1C n=1 Tax=Echinococcus multilocularis TaxID=6211 RepID=A0A068XYD4_ECHMU|nr:TBP associated factor 1C [Echinococcus multilocularis]
MCADFPRGFFPDWWDIHTHKANHLNQLPSIRVPFGNGRSMTADWGRVGSCQLTMSDDAVHVHPQLSCNLAGALHRAGCPEPVLPVHYHRSQKKANLSSSSFSKTLFKELGITQLLDDPVFGEQACATFVCAKFVTFLNQNVPNLSNSQMRRRKYIETRASADNTLKFLELIEKSTSKVLSSARQSEVLQRALEKIVNTVKDLTAEPSEVEEGIRREILRKRRLKLQSPLTPSLGSMFRIPFDEVQAKAVSKYLGFDEEASTETQPKFSQLSYLSCGIDPFLIALSARPVNPDFLGSGCLRVIGEGNPLMLWAPPALTTSTPKIFLAFLSNTVSFPLSTNQYTSFQVPDEFMGSSVCEIDAVQLDDFSLYSIARNTGSQVFTSRTRLKLLDSGSLTVVDCDHTQFNASTNYYKPTSVAICPWCIHSDRSSVASLRWALAGRTHDPVAFPDAHLAVVELFDAGLNRRLWCGRIPLSSEGECITHLLTNSVAASSLDFVDKCYAKFEESKQTYANSFLYDSLLDYCQQVQQKQKGGFLSPEQLLYRAELDFRLSHASTWVRVGFADAPGLLCLATPKRLLCVDTRISGARAAQELFNMATKVVDMDKGRSFNPYESIFHAQPQWYGDTYALLATDYSGLVLDKRMPGHPVLHWSHALRGPLTYAQICDVKDQSGEFPAQAALVAASQMPGELSIMGINFNRNVAFPPTVVGPCMTNGTLTDILDCPLNNLHSGILDPHFCNERFTTGLVGSTAYVLRDECDIKPIGVRGLMLTSRGDIFSEDWYFSEHRAAELHRSRAEEVRSWCLGFNSFNKPEPSLFKVSGLADELLNSVVKTRQKSTKATFELFTIEDVISESKREFADPTYPKELYSDLCQLLTSGSVPPSLSLSRRDEEKKYDSFIDQIIDEAKKKMKK